MYDTLTVRSTCSRTDSAPFAHFHQRGVTTNVSAPLDTTAAPPQPAPTRLHFQSSQHATTAPPQPAPTRLQSSEHATTGFRPRFARRTRRPRRPPSAPESSTNWSSPEPSTTGSKPTTSGPSHQPRGDGACGAFGSLLWLVSGVCCPVAVPPPQRSSIDAVSGAACFLRLVFRLMPRFSASRGNLKPKPKERWCAYAE